MRQEYRKHKANLREESGEKRQEGKTKPQKEVREKKQEQKAEHKDWVLYQVTQATGFSDVKKILKVI